MQLINTKNQKTKPGFTLIELSFAIAFLSVLLLTMTLIANEIINLYRKGYAIKAINQVGRDIIDDVSRSLQSSSTGDIDLFCNKVTNNSQKANCEQTHALYSFYQIYNDTSDDPDDEAGGPIGGAICTGSYSYLWNSAKTFSNGYTGEKLYLIINGTKKENFRLLKIDDVTREICTQKLAEGEYPDATTGISYWRGSFDPKFEIKGTVVEEPVDLLSESDSDLALIDFALFPLAESASSGRAFASGMFILGTIDTEINLTSSTQYCKTQNASMYSADFSYCAINKFYFGTQTSGN